VQIGTAIENTKDVRSTVAKFVKAARDASKRR